MVRAYLLFNSALYLLLGIRTTFLPSSTSSRLGFLKLSSRGHAEYLVVYGGSQLGLGVMFYLLARDATAVRLALTLSIAFYIPVLSYRVMTGLNNHGVFRSSFSSIIVEALLLICAFWLYFLR